MRADDLLFWLKAQPFRPFSIKMASGAHYDISHPEFVRVMRTSLIVFEPTQEQRDVFDRAEMLNLGLIEKIEPIESAMKA